MTNLSDEEEEEAAAGMVTGSSPFGPLLEAAVNNRRRFYHHGQEGALTGLFRFRLRYLAVATVSLPLGAFALCLVMTAVRNLEVGGCRRNGKYWK